MIRLSILSSDNSIEPVELNDVTSITLPTSSGVITIWEHHKNLMSELTTGLIKFKSLDYEREVECSSGVVYVDHDSNVKVVFSVK